MHPSSILDVVIGVGDLVSEVVLGRKTRGKPRPHGLLLAIGYVLVLLGGAALAGWLVWTQYLRPTP